MDCMFMDLCVHVGTCAYGSLKLTPSDFSCFLFYLLRKGTSLRAPQSGLVFIQLALVSASQVLELATVPEFTWVLGIQILGFGFIIHQACSIASIQHFIIWC